ncbi:MAG: 23S rRNA (guanosine(2251)-2'-O)-methyltransferase RlmB [Chlamydiota bacterium]
MATDWIMGKRCLEEVVKNFPERLIRVYTIPSKEEDPLIQTIRQKKVPIVLVSKDKLFSMVHSESHQAFVAEVTRRKYISLSEFLEQTAAKENSFLLLLDSITDPQNMGAILRLAECFQVDGVMWSKNRGSDITPTVAKVSSGASELLELIQVSNLADSVIRLKEADYQVVIADANPKAISLSTFSFPPKTALILGSEGEGLRKRIHDQADYSLYIPMQGKISSLNVSQAAAICLYSWREKAGLS